MFFGNSHRSDPLCSHQCAAIVRVGRRSKTSRSTRIDDRSTFRKPRTTHGSAHRELIAPATSSYPTSARTLRTLPRGTTTLRAAVVFTELDLAG